MVAWWGGWVVAAWGGWVGWGGVGGRDGGGDLALAAWWGVSGGVGWGGVGAGGCGVDRVVAAWWGVMGGGRVGVGYVFGTDLALAFMFTMEHQQQV
ncbi:hypothetical protein L1987_87946 [Smallanthus sonchifolius]|nr:hypothetical protein L1987_87946 [Smallanthus sonchifolius]